MISKPDVNITLTPANTVLDIGTRRDLIVAQSPNASANALVEGLHDFTQDQLDSLLDAGSFSRFQVQQWLDSNRTGNYQGAELDMITLKEEGAAVAAATVVTFTGTSATEDGTIVLSFVSSKLFEQSISVTSGDTPTVIGAAITTAFTGLVAPFVVADNVGVVTSTASDKGTIGLGYGMQISGVPAGITATITPAASGATPPVVTNVMDLVGTRRYQGIVWPSDLVASIDEVTTDFLDDRFNVTNDILDGVAFLGYTNTLALCKTLVNANNSQSLVVVGNAIAVGSSVKDGPEIPHPEDWTATEFMALRARRLTDNASVSSVVSSTASGDQFGGRALASLPYFNTPLDDTPVTTSIALFDGAEQAELNTAGYSVVGPNRSVTDTITGTVVTTYKTDAAGNSNESFKYLNYVDTASICREFLFNNFKSKFVQARLTDGDLIEGRSMENDVSLKAAFKGFLAVLKDDALVRKGRTADKLVDDNLTVVLDLINRTATINAVLPIVTQLEIINMPLQLTFEQ